MYLLRNAFVKYNRNDARPKQVDGRAASTDKLFRNNGNGTFSDVSKEAGIIIEGFGLGVNICDLNNDNWPDVYVSNDFLSNDLMWINNKDGTFTNKAKESCGMKPTMEWVMMWLISIMTDCRILLCWTCCHRTINDGSLP
jgi:hypothetical protein